jgi:hypothetical protein
MKRIWQRGLLAMATALVLSLVASGCTNEHYRKSADKAAYAAIREKTPLVNNMSENFTIEQTNLPTLDSLPLKSGVEEFLGPDGQAESGAPVWSLEKSLETAVNYNRAYQLQKEQLWP